MLNKSGQCLVFQARGRGQFWGRAQGIGTRAGPRTKTKAGTIDKATWLDAFSLSGPMSRDMHTPFFSDCGVWALGTPTGLRHYLFTSVVHACEMNLQHSRDAPICSM